MARNRYISPEIFSCSPTLVFVAQNYPRAEALVCEDCSKKFPAIYLSLGILYVYDNSTRILSTNQIYKIGQYGPITLVLKKLPRKFLLVKIATKNFHQMFPLGYFILYFIYSKH
jgi:hypothetical protein